MTGGTGASCTACVTLRWVLTAAAALITGLYLQSDWAVQISGLLPSPLTIGLGICGIGSLGFLVGLWRIR